MKKKILIVDDNKEFLEIISMKLQDDYELCLAYNGIEALENLKKFNPDVVLLDIKMPKFDGMSVLKCVRKVNKDLPVYILTAYSDREHFESARILNASGFIAKTQDMKQQIDNIIGSLRISDRYKGRSKYGEEKDTDS